MLFGVDSGIIGGVLTLPAFKTSVYCCVIKEHDESLTSGVANMVLTIFHLFRELTFKRTLSQHYNAAVLLVLSLPHTLPTA